MPCVCPMKVGDFRITIDSQPNGDVTAEMRGPEIPPHSALHAADRILKAGIEPLMANLVMKARANAALN